MKSFRDSKDRLWELSISVGTVKRVKGLLKDDAGKPVDLSRLLEDGFKGYAALLSDLSLFVDVLYVLCKPQADKDGVSDEQFGESLGGDSLERAADAFREELIDFFPVSKARESLRKVMAKNTELSMRLLAHGEAKLAAINLDEEVERIVIGSLKSSQPTPVVSA